MKVSLIYRKDTTVIQYLMSLTISNASHNIIQCLKSLTIDLHPACKSKQKC